MMKNAFYFILKSFHSRDIFKNHAENEAVRLVPNLMLLFFEKALYGKSEWSATLFQYISNNVF